MQVLGGLDRGLYHGEIISQASDLSWFTTGSLAIDGTTLLQQNLTIVLDSGTANIVGPTAQIRSLFEALGIQAVEQNLPGCTTVLFGYYPCNSPPAIGFQLGAGNPIFNIEPSAFVQASNGGNNCTATVTGIDIGFPGGLWIVGQSWFQGKYVDFDADNRSVGVALLRNDTVVGAAMPSPKATSG
ncbi:hypothetical protein LTR36_010602 [Oleoguttula mirabilis]|uniref:Peptidase A1 domain-containing protein n=1 Tax=Oleoguttula mirabilis TaxID=1507867 RepID=A0AAV9JSB2_9PEZI|nr:hypothetical protein LTR36_010602 [Oleoguttula mirabilis]